MTGDMLGPSVNPVAALALSVFAVPEEQPLASPRR